MHLVMAAHLSATEGSHLGVIWGGTRHAGLPPPASRAAGESSLSAQDWAKTIHGHMLVQQTAEAETQTKPESARDAARLFHHRPFFSLCRSFSWGWHVYSLMQRILGNLSQWFIVLLTGCHPLDAFKPPAHFRHRNKTLILILDKLM